VITRRRKGMKEEGRGKENKQTNKKIRKNLRPNMAEEKTVYK
jgi:hypothetical protein